MTSGARLRDQGADEFELGLLRSAETDGPEGRAQQQLLVALGVVAVATTAAETAGAANTGASVSTGTALVTTKWVVIALLAGGVGVGALYSLASVTGWHAHAPQPTAVVSPTIAGEVSSSAPAPTPAPYDEPAAKRTQSYESPAEGVPVAGDVGRGVASIPTAASPTKQRSATPPSAAASNNEPQEPSSLLDPQAPASSEAESQSAPDALDPTLAAETRAIDQARSALRQRRPGDALLVLDAYASSFPNGTFEPEATALRVEALIATDNRTAAENLGQAFLRAHPKNPVARQVQSLINQ
jgi:hypothetical protein